MSLKRFNNRDEVARSLPKEFMEFKVEDSVVGGYAANGNL